MSPIFAWKASAIDCQVVDDVSELAAVTLIIVDRLEFLGELTLWFWPVFVGRLPDGITVVAGP